MTIQEEYQTERDRLELNRALDWSTFYREFTAAGEKLVPMRVQDWFDLLAVNSPMIYSKNPTIESLVDYIWRHSKRRTNNRLLKEWRLFWIQRRIIKSLKKDKDREALLDVIREHVKSSLDEYPEDVGKSKQSRTNTMSSVAGEACMVDEIASRYSINPEEVLKMPLRRAFALQRTMRMATIPDYKLLEPQSLRNIKSKYLNSLNNGRQ